MATQYPVYGYGSPTTDAQNAANEEKLKDPAFVASERTRAQGVIAARKASGMDTSAQDAYLKRLMTMPTGGQPGAPMTGTLPYSNAGPQAEAALLKGLSAAPGGVNPGGVPAGSYTAAITPEGTPRPAAQPVTPLPSATPAAAPTAPAAPVTPTYTMSPRAQAILDQIEARLKAPPLTGDQILQTPEYQSGQKAIDFQRQVAQSGLRRSLASRNMLRGTPAVQALAGSDAEYTSREQALVPQLMAAERARQQQELQNLRGVFGDVQGADQQAFNQAIAQAGLTGTYGGAPTFNAKVVEAGLTGQYGGAPTVAGRASEAGLTGFDPVTGKPTFGTKVTEAGLTGKYDGAYTPAGRASEANLTGIDPATGKQTFSAGITEAGATGRYMPQGATDLLDRIFKDKEGYAANPAFASADAQSARNELYKYGIDPALFGAGVTLEQARKNAQMVGYTRQGRTEEANLTGVDPATGQKTTAASLREAQTKRDIAQANLDTAKARAEASKLTPDSVEYKTAVYKMQAAQKDLAKIDAEIGNLNASAASHNASANKASQETPKQTPAEKQAEKRRDQTVASLRSDYNISHAGAEAWAELNDAWQGKTLTPEEKQKDLEFIISKKSGLVNQDTTLLSLLLSSSLGSFSAQEELNKPPFRKKDINSKD